MTIQRRVEPVREFAVSVAEQDCSGSADNDYDATDFELIAKVFSYAAKATRQGLVGEVLAFNAQGCRIAAVTICAKDATNKWHDKPPVLRKFGDRRAKA